jgi:diamine N-acetyltransferase
LLLQSPRVTIRPLTRADLDHMAAWRPFDDSLHTDANWARRPPDELDRWYTRYSTDSRRRLYTVTDEAGQVIGSITLREIDGRSSARLGITLGADFVDQGYGSEALALFLDYFFARLGFKKMVLDVVGYNQRAIRVYEKLGFERVGQRKRSVERREALAAFKELRHADARRFFRRDLLGRYWLLCHEMELTREDWEKRSYGNSEGGDLN